jgi:glycosyltransferase involved in cell wall biosynthesis
MSKAVTFLPAFEQSTTPAIDITAMILTYNEESNIARTLNALTWLKQILIVDSGSTDATLEIVARYPNTRVVTRKFDSFAEQCNFGLTQVTTPWVLSMDADYELTPGAISEVRAIVPSDAVCGYRAGFIYRVYGRPIRAALYPPRTILYRPQRARYRNEGHGHRVVLEGEVRDLVSKIWHDDRKPPARWLTSQQSYARREAHYLLTTPHGNLRRMDRIRLMGWPAPILVFFYTLFWKRCILDGWIGWLYVLQRTLAETLIAIELVDAFERARLTFGNTHRCHKLEP